MATILDEFSHLAYSPEWKSLSITPDSWRHEFDSLKPKLLFVESAWAGNNGAWRHHLAGGNAPSAELKALVQWCNREQVPTVFWNKEDPPHYADFLETAKLFDVLFTSDADMVPRYRLDTGNQQVSVLGFAAQKAFHNPIRPRYGWRSRDVAFAGMYFAHKFPERRNQLDVVLKGAEAASNELEIGLEIFSRMLGGRSEYQFPEPYDRHVVGSLDYRQMLSAYRAYKVFLNVNSVTNSESMCARRIFEITASGTPVLSTPSKALSHVFAEGEIFTVETATDASDTIRAIVRNPELGDRALHLAQRKIWNEHTYGHRVKDIFGAANLENLPVLPPRNVSVLVSTMRPDRISSVLDNVASQMGLTPQLLLLTHGFEVDRALIRQQAGELGIQSCEVLYADKSTPLGECLNLLVSASDGEFVAKMDDDDLYGPNYLLDEMNAAFYSEADIVGKAAHYMFVESWNSLLIRAEPLEHRWVGRVMGPTMLFRKALGLELPFRPLRTGEDSAFLHEVSLGGGKIYSCDKYNFVQVRGNHRHTWQLGDAAAIASGRHIASGLNTSTVFL